MERIRRHLSYANVAATLALVLAMSGGAIAATGGFTSGATLRACANEEGAIRLLKPGKTCRKGQKTVAWNMTGPAGATGAPGTAGATGAAGIPGAKGADGAKGETGEGSPTAWAKVNEAGNLVAGHGVERALKEGVGDYRLTFNRDVSNCGAVATQNEGSGENHVALVDTETNDKAVVLIGKATNGEGKSGAFTIVVYC
jgi:hypothetical protein